MFKKKTIAVVEPSEIINEGITIKLKNTTYFNNVLSFHSLDTFLKSSKNKEVQILLLNPNQIINNEKEFEKWYYNSSLEQLIAIIYQIYTEEQLKIFHNSYIIIQPFTQLINKILTYQKTKNDAKVELKVLSEREKEVLKYLAKGLSVKEIAEKMFLSPHTVLTHRKNIREKTGIKTISGLTVYAVSSKLVSISELDD
jgi:DNA-binding CsgD family transcriptional regulator